MKEKFGNPPSKKPKEGRPPKPREEKVVICPLCYGYGTYEDDHAKMLLGSLGEKECPVCEGTGEVYET